MSKFFRVTVIKEEVAEVIIKMPDDQNVSMIEIHHALQRLEPHWHRSVKHELRPAYTREIEPDKVTVAYWDPKQGDVVCP